MGPLVKIALLLPALIGRAVAQQDGAVTLTLRFLDHAPSFHAGEVIPLELVFSASGPDSYEINTVNYDRSGRLGIEQFHLTPAGRDPLKDYYARGVFSMGGLYGTHRLSDAPWTIRKDLNEWIALDNPGHYSLYVTSGRVIRSAAEKGKPVELRSNSLEFDVIAADAAWQQQTISAAISIVDNPSNSVEERSAAVRSLRFLNVAAAVPELVRLLGTLPDGRTWGCFAGLWGSPERGLVVHTLEEKMSDPDVALTQEYVWNLAKLKFQSDHGAPPPYPEHDPQRQKIWLDRAQSEQADLSALHDRLLARAAALVPSKIGNARAETFRALLQSLSIRNGKAEATLSEDEVAAAFVALSPDQQDGMIAARGDQLKSRVIVEPLKRLLQQPQLPQAQRDTALRLLYEIAPDEATPQILEEIRHPHLDNGKSVSAATLGLLPNGTLPQFDELLAGRLKQESRTRDLDAQLVGRYATVSVLDRVKAIYAVEASTWDCAAEDGFVLYFLRVAPDYGVKRLAAAPGSCMSRSIPAVIRMDRWHEIEPAVVKNLNGGDLPLRHDAAQTLGKYGGPEAEEALWKRLRSFHEEPGEETGFQFALVEALGRAQGWVVTDEQVTELENLTAGHERENVKQWHWSSSIELTITGLSGANLHADINHQYSSEDIASLRKKLGQYPSGTSFRLTISGSGSPAEFEKVKQAIYDTAVEHRLTIESQP